MTCACVCVCVRVSVCVCVFQEMCQKNAESLYKQPPDKH